MCLYLLYNKVCVVQNVFAKSFFIKLHKYFWQFEKNELPLHAEFTECRYGSVGRATHS